MKEEEERGIRGREKKIEEDRGREITIAPQKLLTFGVQFIIKYFQ